MLQILFFSNRNTEICKILYSRGIHSFSTVIAELFSYFIFMEIIFAIILIIMNFALNIDFLKIPQWKYSKNFKELFLFFIRSIPTVFMLCTLHFVLYETVDSVVSGILLQFIFSFIICYVSGCFYPIDFFPELIQRRNNYIRKRRVAYSDIHYSVLQAGHPGQRVLRHVQLLYGRLHIRV